MDWLSKITYYSPWARKDPTFLKSAGCNTEEKPTTSDDGYRDVQSKIESTKRLCDILESILLWENTVNSISVVIVFNILFWSIIILEVRGFAAASSAALVVVLCYSTLECQVYKESKASQRPPSQIKAEKLQEIAKKLHSTFLSLRKLKKEQPGVFCTAICSFSLGLWIVGRSINGVLIAYTICMGILIGPAIICKLPNKIMIHREWDNEIEEFLPAATEDNLQVLRRAGENGEHSTTPISSMSDSQEIYNDEEFRDLRMPSHDDGSTDGIELSELELSSGETDIDGIKFQSGHFEKGSSSEEEAEFQPESDKLLDHSHDSDSEFEIIDCSELINFKGA
ncbi:reticulophagy regulator 3 [Prorops nasuta]|uniref:reticulophagy regulator 3 n=1 Tax=Prorops nasuta TaxID=863751 RepID=UPI0034CD27CE